MTAPAPIAHHFTDLKDPRVERTKLYPTRGHCAHRSVRQALRAVGHHGGIEKRVHWVLDVRFDAEGRLICKDHAPTHLAPLEA